MRLQKTSQMAIHALIVLCHDPERIVTPGEVAEGLQTTPAYMAKILRQLAKAGILHSQRGPTGGFWLARQPKDITLLNIIEACQGPIASNYCEGIMTSGASPCGLHQAMYDLQQGIIKILGKWHLQKIINMGMPDLKCNLSCRLRDVRKYIEE